MEYLIKQDSDVSTSASLILSVFAFPQSLKCFHLHPLESERLE